MAHTAACYCIAIDLIGRYFAVGSADSVVSLWDISEMLCVKTFPKLESPVRTISFNHTGEYLASASEDLFIDISNVQTGRTVHQIPCRAAMNSVEWNPKSNLLAYAGDDKNKYQTDEGVFRIFVQLRWLAGLKDRFLPPVFPFQLLLHLECYHSQLQQTFPSIFIIRRA